MAFLITVHGATCYDKKMSFAYWPVAACWVNMPRFIAKLGERPDQTDQRPSKRWGGSCPITAIHSSLFLTTWCNSSIVCSSGQFDANSIGVLQKVHIMGSNCLCNLTFLLIKAVYDAYKLMFFLFLDGETWLAHRRQFFCYVDGAWITAGGTFLEHLSEKHEHCSMPARSSFASVMRLFTKHALLRCCFFRQEGDGPNVDTSLFGSDATKRIGLRSLLFRLMFCGIPDGLLPGCLGHAFVALDFSGNKLFQHMISCDLKRWVELCQFFFLLTPRSMYSSWKLLFQLRQSVGFSRNGAAGHFRPRPTVCTGLCSTSQSIVLPWKLVLGKVDVNHCCVWEKLALQEHCEVGVGCRPRWLQQKLVTFSLRNIKFPCLPNWLQLRIIMHKGSVNLNVQITHQRKRRRNSSASLWRIIHMWHTLVLEIVSRGSSISWCSFAAPILIPMDGDVLK